SGRNVFFMDPPRSDGRGRGAAAVAAGGDVRHRTGPVTGYSAARPCKCQALASVPLTGGIVRGQAAVTGYSRHRSKESPVLNVAHHDWSSPLRRPAMSNDQDVRPGVSLTSRCLIRDGVPVIPVSGEIHYSRVPRDRWRTRLR